MTSRTRDFVAAQHSGLAAATVAVLPVAATEQHYLHLPLSVYSTLLQGVIDAALPLLPAALPVLFLPPQNIGPSPEHSRYPGTLTLSPSTQAGAVDAAGRMRRAPALKSCCCSTATAAKSV